MENSLENLTQYILNEADEKAKALLSEAVEQARVEHAQAKDTFDAMFAQQKEQMERQSKQRITDALRQYGDKRNKERTHFALQLIDQLYGEAETRLCGMSPNSFLDFYRNSLSGLPLGGAYRVILGQITAETLSDEARRALARETGRYSVVIADETIPREGGFVLEQSPVEFSFLFSDLLGEIKRKEAPVLLKKLMQ